MVKKDKPNEKPAEVHEDLAGFDIKIDTFGQMDRNTSVERLRNFLDKQMDDKRIPKDAEEE